MCKSNFKLLFLAMPAGDLTSDKEVGALGSWLALLTGAFFLHSFMYLDPSFALSTTLEQGQGRGWLMLIQL